MSIVDSLERIKEKEKKELKVRKLDFWEKVKSIGII